MNYQPLTNENSIKKRRKGFINHKASLVKTGDALFFMDSYWHPFSMLLPASTALIIILVTALYPLIYFIWVHNIWAVTNLRVIDEGGFFTRYAKESPLDKINNIEYDQSFWGRILGYGNVDIQTAAEMGETNYQMIHHPKLLKDTITRAQEEYKTMQVNKQADQLAKAIAGHVGASRPTETMVADELKKLFELMQAGAITQEEYIAQKNKLLNK